MRNDGGIPTSAIQTGGQIAIFWQSRVHLHGQDHNICSLLVLLIKRFFDQNSFKKYKAVPLPAWSDPEGSRKLRFPDFMTMVQDVGKVVRLTHRPPSPPGKIHLVLISVRG